MPTIDVEILDLETERPVAAQAHVLDAGGRPVFPPDAARKVGPGLAGFYAEGSFAVDVPSGLTTVRVEKGTEHEPVEVTLPVCAGSSEKLTVSLKRWIDLPKLGWYPGNLHLHYDEREERPDERLRLDPQVHDLYVTVISRLIRRDLPYATNAYSVGRLDDVSDEAHLVDCGQENRHNREPWEIGYGHVLLTNITESILPLSSGLLIGDGTPDYPPLSMACDNAREQGGLVIWCHNGAGMEAPVAAVLGKVDVVNLFDPFRIMPAGYDIWYRLLNCGIRVPAATGCDWYVCSNNRVYVQVEGDPSYKAWCRSLRSGNTFISNGPALFIRVNGSLPGDTVVISSDDDLEVEITWRSHYAIGSVELIHNGRVVEQRSFPNGSEDGTWVLHPADLEDGWLAARVDSMTRDSFFQPVFAHTSPIWLEAGQPSDVRSSAAASFLRSIDEAKAWVRTCGRFDDAGQRNGVLDLFRQGEEAFRRLL